MTTSSTPRDFLRAAVMALPNVMTRRLFGAEAFFLGRRMFAILMRDGIVLKLPDGERDAALASHTVRPFLVGEHATFGRWVEAPITGGEELARIYRLVKIAHAAALLPQRDGRRPRRMRRKATPGSL